MRRVHAVHVFIPLKGVLKRVRGDLSDMHQVGRMSAIIWNPEAPYVATQRVIRQKSADVIVIPSRRPERRSERRSSVSWVSPRDIHKVIIFVPRALRYLAPSEKPSPVLSPSQSVRPLPPPS
ncbi:MAG: hypothetical protein A4E65_03173 [Syntrophorhabdus sp. PtaU1.Bin153]|nr:MAG: hypothetical protein A4E65_03173 [Syntrophorhabdus sp. PtaU1.Bin153]